MLIRLILALLVACLSLPAMAATPACDGGPVAMAGMEHHAPDQDRDAPAPHWCIGCAPLPDLAPRAAAPVILGEPELASAAPTLKIGGGTPPALPPPRIG